jgi:hypothetical protein
METDFSIISAAAGKSTFVRLLEEQSKDWEVVPEPIARWCNVQTQHSEFEVQYAYLTHPLNEFDL